MLSSDLCDSIPGRTSRSIKSPLREVQFQRSSLEVGTKSQRVRTTTGGPTGRFELCKYTRVQGRGLYKECGEMTESPTTGEVDQ